MKKFLLLAILALASAALAEVEWTNVDEDHYVAGRKCSVGYLKGKVVLVCQDASLSPRMEEIWTSYKSKPFVLLGSLARKPKDVSFSVYTDCGVAEPSVQSPLYVVDSMGRLRYWGKDERRATEVFVMLLTDMESPKTVVQWKQFLTYEFENLPGRGCLRYQDFKKANPAAAKEFAARYNELMKQSDVKKLVDLVRLSRTIKDAPIVNPKKARLVKSRLESKIKEALSKYAPLKESENPQVVQEAKNALADLAWAKAAL